jgi:site-specific DNA-methyltransferase (adenine-specific)
MREVIGCDDSLSFEFKDIERKVIGLNPWTNSVNHFVPGADHTLRTRLSITAPTTDAAKQWSGWGTALKPACEDWWLCRKPLAGTIAENVLQHGTGGLNIDGCRIDIATRDAIHGKNPHTLHQATNTIYDGFKAESTYAVPDGRWPANVITSYPEDEYALRSNVTTEQKKELFKWLYENS